jgi:F420-0:gamma-glutamyl ligase-like protein
LALIAKPIRTRYWRPGDNFLKIVTDSVAKHCKIGDIVVISEKALSVAMGRIVDESNVHPSLMAKLLARVWMRFVWGYVLGPLCHLSDKTLRRLRKYPLPEGEVHKEIVLRFAGFGQSLLYYSEGGVDVTNVPYALAVLPLSDPEEVGEMLRKAAKEACSKEVTVMITDTDKTYSRNRVHLTPRPGAIRGVRQMGLLALILGRGLRWTARATPLAISGTSLAVEDALAVADVADRARGFGAGRTVWDMAARFHVALTDVTWEMLERVEHCPIVLVRKVE